MAPFLPFTSQKLKDLLNIQEQTGSDNLLSLMNKLAEGENILQDDHQVGKAEHLFSRISDEEIEEQVNRLKASEKQEESKAKVAPIQEPIDFEDFQKLDLRTGIVLTAEKVKKTKKLLKIQVDLGVEERTVVSGIAGFFEPEQLIGRQVVLVANLEPRKIKGIKSEGMILMAEDAAGTLNFVGADSEVLAGSRVK